MSYYKARSPAAWNEYGTPGMYAGVVRIWIGPGQGFQSLRAVNRKENLDTHPTPKAR